MALIGIQNLSIGYGGPLLLDDVGLQIERGERIALVGRNGAGKSTLLRLLAGQEKADRGEIAIRSGVRVGDLPQTVPRDLPGTALEVVLAPAQGPAAAEDADQRARRILTRLGLEPEEPFNALSGGQKRRALLARALLHEPDVLLLDEPTNHLDLAAIEWLESFLARYPGAILFVTHDRAFLRRLATRIVELDRGRLTSWAHGYDRYLQLRQELREAEEKQAAQFDKKLAQEETWLRQGVKARRTRNEGRVRALLELRQKRASRRAETGRVATMQIPAADRSGQKVIAVENLSYAWNDVPLISAFETTIMRGDKIGLIGPNGCGKTTLLKLLLGQLPPQVGTVRHGTKLEIAYFDQHRETLDDNRTVAENVSGDNAYVTIDDRRRHIIGYLEDFLFPPERSRSPVSVLSGGERNRLLLARLFTRPSNVLVLDEPTNDLDAETLELLEDLLVEYPGTVLLVSHDREFLNNVVSGTLVFEGEGRVAEYVGGYDDWLRQRAVAPATAAAATPVATASRRTPKLTFRQQRDLGALPARIEALETEIAALHAQLGDPAFFRSPQAEVQRATDRTARLQKELEAAYAQWQTLESLRTGGGG